MQFANIALFAAAALAGEVPAYGAPVYETTSCTEEAAKPTAPVYESSSAPVYSAPVYSAPVYSAPVYSAPVYSAPVYSSKIPIYSSKTSEHPVKYTTTSAPVYSAPAESTIYETVVSTINSCAPEVTDCPFKHSPKVYTTVISKTHSAPVYMTSEKPSAPVYVTSVKKETYYTTETPMPYYSAPVYSSETPMPYSSAPVYSSEAPKPYPSSPVYSSEAPAPYPSSPVYTSEIPAPYPSAAPYTCPEVTKTETVYVTVSPSAPAYAPYSSAPGYATVETSVPAYAPTAPAYSGPAYSAPVASYPAGTAPVPYGTAAPSASGSMVSNGPIYPSIKPYKGAAAGINRGAAAGFAGVAGVIAAFFML